MDHGLARVRNCVSPHCLLEFARFVARRLISMRSGSADRTMGLPGPVSDGRAVEFCAAGCRKLGMEFPVFDLSHVTLRPSLRRTVSVRPQTDAGGQLSAFRLPDIGVSIGSPAVWRCE